MRRILFVLMALAVLGGTANAQRLLPSQGGLELWGGVPVQERGMFTDGSFNAGIGCMKYLKHYHYYHFGANYSRQHYRYGDMKVPVRDYLADGGSCSTCFPLWERLSLSMAGLMPRSATKR